MKTAILVAFKLLLTPLVTLFAPLFYLVARTGVGASVCRRFNFQPILIHYYEPVPDYESVPPGYFKTKQAFPGFTIDLDVARQMLGCMSVHASECQWPEHAPAGGGYYSLNHSFGYSSAAILHSILRAVKTKAVVEVGSGFSSQITLEALQANHPGGFSFTAVEPFPSAELKRNFRNYGSSARLIVSKAENVDLNVYFDLGAGDALFIDSSHVSKLNSDVNFLFLQVLPRLRKGVLVHIHDIYIPYEYPRAQFYGRRKYFWNEQYMLQAFLTGNHEFQVIFPGAYVQRDMAGEFQRAFPHYDPARHRVTSSFWLRKM